jgi:hypothetical protein
MGARAGVIVDDPQSTKSGPLIQLARAADALEADAKSRFYEFRDGKIWFADDIKQEHERLRTSLLHYIVHSRILAIVTAPFIYACIVPFALLDLFVSLYQAVCFPVYGIPKARRGDYMAIDRKRLRYLNALEGVNCLYCSYANGLLAYVVEVAGRTEQHWCPIKHARRIQHTHDRYANFLPYGDAVAYREHLEAVRNDFTDPDVSQ